MNDKLNKDSAVSSENGENAVKDTPGGAYKAYFTTEDGQRLGGAGTSLNGMFRGDCKKCDHLGCDQCNWEESK